MFSFINKLYFLAILVALYAISTFSKLCEYFIDNQKYFSNILIDIL